MKRWLLVLLIGCNPSVDQSSPAGVAHTFATAMHTKDRAALRAISPPRVRAELDTMGEQIWVVKEGQARLLDKIANATDADFHLETSQGKQAEIGDKDARLELGQDAFEVVRAPDGKWYLFDTGL